MGVRAVLLVLVIGAGVGTAAGIRLGLDDVRATRDAFYRDQGLADLDVRLRTPVDSARLLGRARAAGASRAETRLVLPGTVLLASGERPAAELVGMSPTATLDRLAVVEGALPATASRKIAVEADFARNAGLRVGDVLRVRVGSQILALQIAALVRSPEYLLATANPDYLIPLRGSLAPIFLPRAALQTIAGADGRANDLVVDFPPGTPSERQLELAAGLPVAKLIPRSQQYSLRFTNADINSFSFFTPVLAAVFAAVGLLLVALSLRRVVHAQRRELGALLALGYRRRTVVATALLPAALLALGGALVAAAMTVAVGYLITEEYVRAVGFPRVVHELAAGPLAFGTGVAAGATMLAAALPAVSVARLRPTAAMRGEALPAFTLPPWLERATSGAGPAAAYAVRTLLRRPLWSAATVLSVAAAIALGTALEIVVTSTDRSIDTSLGRQAWSATADLTRPLPVAEATALARRAGAPRVEPVVKGSARLLAPGGHTAEVQLVGLPATPSLQRLDVTAGEGPARDAIALSEQVAAELHVRPGARLTVATASARRKLRVSGTVRTLAGQSAFLPQSQAGALLGLAGRATSVLVTGDATVERALGDQPQVARVTSKSAALKGMHDVVKELTTVVDVLLAISLVVGGLFLVSSLALSMLDREGELATLRALGYGRRELTVVLGGEAGAQVVLAALLSIPLGIAIAWPLARRIGQAWFRIGLSPSVQDFGVVIALALALGALATAFAVRRALRLGLAATVRARLLG